MGPVQRDRNLNKKAKIKVPGALNPSHPFWGTSLRMKTGKKALRILKIELPKKKSWSLSPAKRMSKM
jgi:hypothetical protein